MTKWIDLNDKLTGGKLKVANIEGATYLFIVGMSNASPRWKAAEQKLGFISGGNGRFLIRKAQPGEKTSARFFHPVWPNAQLVEMDPKDFVLDLNKGKPRQQATEEERQLANETANAVRLGRNADGDEVYEAPLGRFVWRERYGASYESPNLRPAMLLRAPDEESLDLCADGFVRGMAMGEVQHSEDFERFLAATSAATLAAAGEAPPTAARRDRAHTALDAAVVRHLRREFETAQDAYGESVRLYEYLPPYSGAPRGRGAMPAPLSIIAQRLLGDTAGKRVVIPNAFDGASFAFLPAETAIRAFRGAKDLSGRAEQLQKSIGDSRSVEWADEFMPAREAGSDALFFNADPTPGRDGSRSDYSTALMSLRALASNGRAVLVLAGDDSRRPGVLSAESERFMRTLGQRYDIEMAVEVGGELAQRVGTSATLRVISLANRAPDPENNPWATVETLKQIHSWDDLKAEVDEALVQAKVREAQAESVDVERAANVNRYQSPYIAFSRVSEARTMVPKNLQAPLQAALSAVEAVHGPVDQFVEAELGFGEGTLSERFTAEQVDAQALMMARMKKGRGAVLADETGIGKGRTLSGLCTWASKQGRPVIFITDRANLFSDLARDLRDIGEWGRFNPLVTNADGNVVDTLSREEPAPILAHACPPTRMKQILEQNIPIEELPENIVFSTYSQIAGEESEKARWIKNQLSQALLVVDEAHIAAGSDSTIARQLSEMTNLAWNVVYSSATWAKSSENLHIYARALPETINIATLTDTMRNAGEGFAEVFSSMLASDGALIRREHDLSRLEFVLEVDAERLERNRAVADQVATIMGQIGLVSGDLEKMMVRLSRASIDNLKAARAALREGQAAAAAVEAQVGGKASLFKSAFGAGSMLYQVQRRMNAALNIDNGERLAMRALGEGRKPVIVFDDTCESFVQRAMREMEVFDERGRPIRPDNIKTPTLRDLMRKVVEDLATIKVSEMTYEEVMRAERDGLDVLADDEAGADGAAEADAGEGDAPALEGEAAPVARGRRAAGGVEVIDVEQVAAQATAAAAEDEETEVPVRRSRRTSRRIRFDQVPGLSEQQKRTFQEGLREINAHIDALPALPLSVADELHARLRARGLRTGEISGRNFMLEPQPDGNSRILPRPKSKALVNATVKAYNGGNLDVVIINRSAATGLSLHASPRFVDQRRRELVELQPPENPTERQQLYGRVNRLDQLSFPRISIASTGIPGEVRQIMMNNKKLQKMSANVRSSRETHAVITEVVDLLNPLGKEVCRQFFLDNPLYASRMMVDIKRIEDKAIDAAAAFTRYVSLLPVQQQEHLYEQINGLFDEAVLKADLMGENPLKPKELDIRAKTLARTILFGIDHGGLGSAFDGPVYACAVSYEETLKPMGWGDVTARVAEARQRLIDSGAAQQIGTMLDERRTPIITLQPVAAKTVEQIGALARTALAATSFATTEDALSDRNGMNPVKRGMARKLWLENNLHRMVPGARIALPHPNEYFAKTGSKVPHVIVDIIPPREGRESQLAQWKLLLAKAGNEHPVPYSLNSLMTDVTFLRDLGDGRGHDAVSPVIVGGDMILHPKVTANEMVVESFDRAPTGRRRRQAAILNGNMYLASEFATEAKLGKGMVYTDERGLRHRGVLLDKAIQPSDLGRMPVRVNSAKAVERLLLEMAGLSEGRVVRGEDGVERAGEPALEPGHDLMHTSFAGAWRAQTTRTETHDAFRLVPGQGLLINTSKDQAKRIQSMLRAAQKAIRQQEAERKAAAEQRAAEGQAPQVAAASEETTEQLAAADAPVDAGAAAATVQPEPAAAGRRGAKKRSRAKVAAEDPDHVVIGGSKKGQRSARDAAGVTILTAATPGQMRRAIRMLIQGVGLQLYVDRNSAAGNLARQIVREVDLARLRADIGDDAERLAKLEEQIARMDTEAVASQAAFRQITEQAFVRDLLGLDLVETADGAVITEEAAAAAALQAEEAANAEQAEEGGEDDEHEVERPRRAA